ncbi:MAG: DoxX family protein [Streptosporangiaceae bacterium]
MITTTIRAEARKARPRSRASTLLWTAQIALAAVFVIAAVSKLAGAHSAAAMFARIGAGQWLRYLVGTAELAGAIGLLIPAVAGLAAAGLCLDMLGATIVNAAILHSGAVVLTAVLCIVLAAVASAALGRNEAARLGPAPS